ncbi:hypothetical protein HK104_002210 [Borealophlyctis nickersoniae]|nr:hypothetical protein HK104_002210 [Borealophlyctis nickersoniae]
MSTLSPNCPTPKIIATHSGSFHADESLAVYMLKLLPEYSNAEIIRTRDAAVLETASIVVDVGGEYVPERNRFDHHQREFKETFDDAHDIKLSSAGLVYKHFGRDVISVILGWAKEDPRLEVVYQKVYDDVILAVSLGVFLSMAFRVLQIPPLLSQQIALPLDMQYDGNDNGVSQYPADIKPKYRNGSSIASRVSRLNPWWNEKGVDYMERFLRAVEMTGTEFVQSVRYIGLSWLPARVIVEKALADRFNVHPSGTIIVFNTFCPWKEHLHALEAEHNIEESKKPIYALYEDDTAKQWRVQAVPVAPESFQSRKPLPEPWRGVRDQALSDLTGIPGGVFVHASGFIGGNQTKEGALAMATNALTFDVAAQ